ADSKRVRGEPAFGIEQLVRDAEMYRIGEGATDILRPFVAREALNMHLERARNYFDEQVTGRRRLVEAGRLFGFYAAWYVKQWVPRRLPSRPEFRHPKVQPKLRFVERASRRLSRATLYALVWQRQALRDDQGRQNRIESIGEDLLLIATATLSAEAHERTTGHVDTWDLADEVVRQAKVRVKQHIRTLISNRDRWLTGIGKKALGGTYPALSEGIIKRSLHDY
ncbi:MAG: hypothetical protein AAB111_04820, partial [Nitrospirota bacterium]